MAAGPFRVFCSRAVPPRVNVDSLPVREGASDVFAWFYPLGQPDRGKIGREWVFCSEGPACGRLRLAGRRGSRGSSCQVGKRDANKQYSGAALGAGGRERKKAAEGPRLVAGVETGEMDGGRYKAQLVGEVT